MSWGSSQTPSLMSPINGAWDFAPSLTDLRFKAFLLSNQFRVKHFLHRGSWLTFSEIRDMLSPLMDDWRAMQIRHFLATIHLQNLSQAPISPFKQHCLDTSTLCHTLLLSYSLLNNSPKDYVPALYIEMGRGVEYLNRTLTDKQRDHVLFFAHRSSISTRYQETGYKLLTCWYRALSLLHKIFPSVSSLYW